MCISRTEWAIIIHQSDLAAWSRCPQQLKLYSAGYPKAQLSATAYGSVMHKALHVLELQHDVDAAVETFKYFWHPANIDQVCEPVSDDGWLPGHTYSALRKKGIETIQKFWEVRQLQNCQVLGLEYEFMVPIPGTWDAEQNAPHTLAGTVDRLELRWRKGKEQLAIVDHKTGQRKRYLRHNLQGTGYALASTLRPFWDGFGALADEFYQRFKPASRRFIWIDLRDCDFADGGYRNSVDYQRFALAVEEYVRAVRLEVFPPNLTGEVCTFCDVRDHCLGIPLPRDETPGNPF